jgi:anti-sigma-K factor RskA
MTDSSRYTDQELELLSSLRALQPDDAHLESPPADLWAGIERAVTAQSGAQSGADDEGATAPARRRWWAVAASAAAVVVAVGVGSAAWLGNNDDETIIAATDLSSDGLDGAPAGLRGEAEVIESNGKGVIRVDIGGLRPASGEYLEVWLIKPDVSGMVSLGTVRPDGTYEFPSGLRLTDYPIVDVSTEPYDGDPSHSGASLLRGTLDT